MSLPRLSWTRLLPRLDPEHAVGRPGPRSSHGVSYLPKSSRLLIHGGERLARTPLDARDATWACDFDDPTATAGRWRAIVASDDEGERGAPPARVAHAQAFHDASSCLYVFGGRHGIHMDEEARNDLWKLDCSGPPGTEAWSEVTPRNGPNDLPEARSFHRMVCLGDGLYVFGGCGASGRLADLHRFDLNDQTWQDLGRSRHLRGRGGASLLPLDGGRRLGVVAGFAGEETNDGHAFDVASREWEETSLTADLEGLRPRSVCVSGSFPEAGVAVLFGGEVDPSARGHEGAGGHENDVVFLEESTGRYLDTASMRGRSGVPEPRGWADGAAALGEDGGSLLVFGGLAGDDAAPRRLDDLWKLEITKA